MAIVSHNLYDADTDEQLNSNPILVGNNGSYTGLASDTTYNVYATNVDQSGNESVPSSVFSFTTPAIEEPTEDEPMSPGDIAAIDSIVGEYVNTGTNGALIPGAAIGVAGPPGFMAKGYGRNQIQGFKIVTTDTNYRMASITKVFVAYRILMLLDAGLISLADKLSQYVSGVDRGDEITIQHLLMMRSGVYDYSTSPGVLIRFALNPGGSYSRDQSLKIIRDNKSRFTPGTQYQYSNSNYVLLGLILEAVVGKPIQEILIDDVATPLGLTTTRWPTTSSIPEPTAGGKKISPWLLDAAGVLTTTIPDMVKFGAALQAGTLLSPESKALWESTFCPVPFATAEGLFGGIIGDILGSPPILGPADFGFGLGLMSFGEWFGYNGSTVDFGTVMMYHPSGTVVAGMHNITGGQILTPIFVRIAEYLHPGSTTSPGYTPC